MNEKPTILNLEWCSSNSRDRLVASLVCNYLRYCGCNVIEDFVFNGYESIDNNKPDLLFMTNSVGADINLKLVKYARFKSIPTITLIAEGNFTGNQYKDVEIFTWGINKKKKLYENFTIYWSTLAKSKAINFFPELKSKIVVSGSVGSDIYKIKRKKSTDLILEKYKFHSFSRIIGIGCWEFGFLYESDPRYPMIKKFYGEKAIEKLKVEEHKFNEILLEIIKQNSDILFVIKLHPGSLKGMETSGTKGLAIFDNVLIIKDEESIFDVINLSDFWLTFESTTAYESWLLGKQTCLLNPTDFEWNRTNVHKGSPKYRTVEELQRAIDQFYTQGNLPGFREKEEYRNKIISEITEFSDGFNHVRAGNFIINQLDNNLEPAEKDIMEYLWLQILAFKQKLLWQYGKYLSFIPYFKSIDQRKNNFNSQEVIEFSKDLMEDQIKFYEKMAINLKNFQVEN